MSSRTDFTTAQWESLVAAGPAIALTVASAAGSRGHSEDELGAFVDLVARSAADHAPEESLLAHVIADTHGRLAAGWRPQATEPYMDGIEAARRVGAILAVAAEPSDAVAIREWLLHAARTVAAASREGGVLGIGGELVSAHEREAIDAIADALGGEPGTS